MIRGNKYAIWGEKFRIISAYLDNLRNYETVNELDVWMNIQKADISCIQETHNVTDNGGEGVSTAIIFSFPKMRGEMG